MMRASAGRAEHVSLRSMTGYGRAERRTASLAVTVEVRSVNARHLAPRVRLPGEWLRLEPKVEAEVRRRLRRGAVDVFVRIDLLAGARIPRIDRAALEVYRRALAELGDGAGGAELLRLPGVVTLAEPEISERALERAVLAALKDALEAVDASRGAEGARLRRVLDRELNELGRHLAALRRAAPKLAKNAQATIRERLNDLLDGRRLAADDPILLREVALLADRVDVSEELDRLGSHREALARGLDSEEPVGRELDFLLQEVGREVNTVGSKCSDVSLTARVVAMKSCVERLREQAANLE